MSQADGPNLAGAGVPAKYRHARISLRCHTPAVAPVGFRAAGADRILEPDLAAAARLEMRGWPEYAPTPLVSLPGLATRLGVAEVRCKDESRRFGIGAFKALGGAYAVLGVLQDEIERRAGVRPGTESLLSGHVNGASSITTVTASAGNHGRAVAWGSALFGCRCVVVLPEGTAPARAAAIESHGATVEWYPGVYDEAVLHVERIAGERGWLVVSDTAYDGYETIPRRIYEGYTLLAAEVLDTLREEDAPPLTHLFVQAGVGGLATGVCGHLWAELESARPRCVAVEPVSADCFGKSIRSGELRTVDGPFDTHMGGLASGVPSPLAWELLSGCLDAGVAISDEVSDAGAAALASGELGARIAAGPSGASGVGALLVLEHLPSARELLQLDDDSRILVLVTETTFREAADNPGGLDSTASRV